MIVVREQSRQKFAVSFQGEDLKLFVPGSVRYRLDDRTDNCVRQVLDWQDVTPDTSVEITVPASANTILNNSNRFELRVLTVQTDYGTDNQLSADETYRLQNLRGFQ